MNEIREIKKHVHEMVDSLHYVSDLIAQIRSASSRDAFAEDYERLLNSIRVLKSLVWYSQQDWVRNWDYLDPTLRAQVGQDFEGDPAMLSDIMQIVVDCEPSYEDALQALLRAKVCIQ